MADRTTTLEWPRVSLTAFATGLASTALLGLVSAKFLRSLPGAVLTVFLFLSSPIVLSQLWKSEAQSLELAVSLAWVLATVFALERPQLWTAAVPGVFAGAGLYVNGAAMVRMPFLAALAAFVIWNSGTPAARRKAALVVAVFVAFAAPIVIHYARHPELFNQRVAAHRLYDVSRLNLLQGGREILSWVGLVARSEAYHDYYDPAVWFLSGTSLAAHMTEPHVLLIPLAFLLPAGIYRLLSVPTPATYLILGMMLVAPLPTALLVSRPAPAQLLFAVPAVMISAMLGAQHLLASSNRLARFTAYGVFAAMVPAIALAGW